MSVRKGIQLKSDVKISESFENAPAQLLVAGPPSYLQFLGKIEVKCSHTHTVTCDGDAENLKGGAFFTSKILFRY